MSEAEERRVAGGQDECPDCGRVHDQEELTGVDVLVAAGSVLLGLALVFWAVRTWHGGALQARLDAMADPRLGYVLLGGCAVALGVPTLRAIWNGFDTLIRAAWPPR